MGVIINFPTLIENTGIDTSDATATASDIVTGKTAYVDGEKITGTQSITWLQGAVSNEVTSVNIFRGVTRIGVQAFYHYSSLASVTIPDSVTEISIGAFSGCTSLASITIPDSVTEIGRGVFVDCISLTSITIPDSVTSIITYTFYGCTSLTSVTIGDSVTSIEGYAFQNCSSLANIYYKGTEEQWNAITKGTDWNLNMGSNVEGGTVITYNYTG